MLHQIPGYKILKQVKADITTDEGNTAINGATVYLHNAGSSIIYIDISTGVDNTKWEIGAGEKTGPFTFKDTLYFKGAGTSALKILFVEVK